MYPDPTFFLGVRNALPASLALWAAIFSAFGWPVLAICILGAAAFLMAALAVQEAVRSLARRAGL